MVDGVDDEPLASAIEAALLGAGRVSEVNAWLAATVEQLTGSAIATILFRTGRVDAVFGVETVDGRRLLVKVHRPPVDLAGRRAARTAQLILARAGFPAPSLSVRSAVSTGES